MTRFGADSFGIELRDVAEFFVTLGEEAVDG